MNSSLNRVSANFLLVMTADACPLLYPSRLDKVDYNSMWSQTVTNKCGTNSGILEHRASLRTAAVDSSEGRVARETAMRTVKDALREKLRYDHDYVRHKDAAVITDSDLDALVESELYYRRPWFRQHVPRSVLPPSKLYPRVRAELALVHFSLLNNALFSNDKRTKANSVWICLRSSGGFILQRASQQEGGASGGRARTTFDTLFPRYECY